MPSPCLLGSPRTLEGKVVEVTSQKELASLAGGLDWSGNNTIYVMVPTLSQENSTSPVNESTYLQTDALSSLKQMVRGISGENMTAEEAEATIALRAGNNRYVSLNAKNDNLYANGDGISSSEKFHLIGLGVIK